MSEQLVLQELNDGILTLTLNRPDKANALNPPMMRQLTDAMRDAAANAQARVVIVTGAGKAFCAGGDIGGKPEKKKDLSPEEEAAAAERRANRPADTLVNRIKWPAAATKELGTNYYWGGDEVAVRIAFQRFNGHDLEKMIKAVFPMLEKRYQAEGALGTAIIERVLRELPNLMPKPLVELMQRLANDEP